MMFKVLKQLVAQGVGARLVLLVNHVLAAEPVAAGRLRPHAGRCLRLQLTDWPELLPTLPVLSFVITPAGLMEWQPDADRSGACADSPVDLDITLNAGNPAGLLFQGLMGQKPAVSVAGDAALAADVSWVMDNVRWDVRDDLARAFGDLPAGELSRRASALAEGLRSAVDALVQRVRAAKGSSPAQRPAR